jgi:hypothetical protein
MKIENEFLPMEFRMRIHVPNETLRRFHPPIKYDDNLFDQWNWKIHPFPYLGHLDGVLEFDHCQFHLFDFNFLLLHVNYFKLLTIKIIYR